MFRHPKGQSGKSSWSLRLTLQKWANDPILGSDQPLFKGQKETPGTHQHPPFLLQRRGMGGGRGWTNVCIYIYIYIPKVALSRRRNAHLGFLTISKTPFQSAQAPCKTPSRGLPWTCLLPRCDVGFIKQRLPLGVLTSNRGFPWACLHQAEGSLRVYYQVVM